MNTKHNNKGMLRIDTDHSSRVIFEPVNSTVWLGRADLTSLFGVNLQKINAVLHSLIEQKLIDTEEVCKYDLVVSGNRVKHDVREVRLEVVIAMAFQINSRNALVLREWFIKRCLKPGICDFPFDMEQDFGWN